MEYKIVRADKPSELTSKVNELLNQGWEPVGSHQVVVYLSQNVYRGNDVHRTEHSTDYTQTLIKK